MRTETYPRRTGDRMSTEKPGDLMFGPGGQCRVCDRWSYNVAAASEQTSVCPDCCVACWCKNERQDVEAILAAAEWVGTPVHWCAVHDEQRRVGEDRADER